MTATHNRNSTTNFICITMKIQYCKSYWALSCIQPKRSKIWRQRTEISKKTIKPGYSAQTGRGRITANQTTQFSNFGKLILRIPKRQLIASLLVKDIIIIRCKFFFLFIGREPTTWTAKNCLQIMVCSCAMSSNCSASTNNSDQLATDKTRYFAKPCPITDKCFFLLQA